MYSRVINTVKLLIFVVAFLSEVHFGSICISSFYFYFPTSSKFTREVILRVLAAAKLLQSCPTLWDPIDSSPPGSPAPGILQKRTLEWVAISFSNAWKCLVKCKHWDWCMLRLNDKYLVVFVFSSREQINIFFMFWDEYYVKHTLLCYISSFVFFLVLFVDHSIDKDPFMINLQIDIFTID